MVQRHPTRLLEQRPDIDARLSDGGGHLGEGQFTFGIGEDDL